MKMTKGIITLVRLSCENSIKLAKAINPQIIVIPIYDLISETGQPKRMFNKIKELGGFHKALDYNGIIILSSVMKDDLIKKFNLERYAEIINTLNPDFYFTPDGSTYEGRDKESLQEITRISFLTVKLIKFCPNSQPLGLVKGSNISQIRTHKDFLKRLGIKIFIFHTGDFFRNADANMIQRAKYYCSIIKEENNLLMLYGLGSPKRMLEFSFADFFITYTHFVNAKHGKIFTGIRKKIYNKPDYDVYELAFYNFKEISNYLKRLKCQTKLFKGGKCIWGADMRDQEQLIQNQKIKE